MRKRKKENRQTRQLVKCFTTFQGSLTFEGPLPSVGRLVDAANQLEHVDQLTAANADPSSHQVVRGLAPLRQDQVLQIRETLSLQNSTTSQIVSQESSTVTTTFLLLYLLH